MKFTNLPSEYLVS